MRAGGTLTIGFCFAAGVAGSGVVLGCSFSQLWYLVVYSWSVSQLVLGRPGMAPVISFCGTGGGVKLPGVSGPW